MFLLAASLVVGSILLAMLGALTLFLTETGWKLKSSPEFYQSLAIILVGVAVNVGCVFVLLQLKRADHRVMPPKT